MFEPDTLDYLLHHIVALLNKQSDQVLQEQLGLTLSQFKILRILQTNNRTSQKDIAVTLGQTEASISRQIKLMMEHGLLQGHRNTEDKREHLIVLTPKGEQWTMVAVEALSKYYAPVFKTYGAKPGKQLTTALLRLHDGLCDKDHTASV